jgi:glycosyltransferase involved in cell wall biosynthesis
MIPEDFPNYFMDFNPSLSKRRYYLECDAVICVSQYTKKRLIANYGEGAAPIFVVHHASRFQLTQAEISSRIIVKSKPPIIKLLFVGSRVGYKRFDLILRAISQILDQIPSVELTCVGGGAFTKSEREMMTQLSILIRQVNCNDSELRELYLKSDLYLCASETEGFGLPTLEAMAMGCPALVSDIEVFEEICGDTVWKFQSGNANDLSKKMKQLILDSKLRDSLAEKALLRSKKYTWEKTAEETVAVYKAALNSVRVLKK